MSSYRYSVRDQIAEEKAFARNKARLDAMAQVTNEIKLEGNFPHVAEAMTTFLKSFTPPVDQPKLSA
jgi:hypothetical protein